jgi:hypothetical protein
MITVTVRSVGGGVYRPRQLQMELGLNKTQFTKWVKALGLNEDGKRKHFYTPADRAHLLRFRSLLNQCNSLETAFIQWQKQNQSTTEITTHVY